MAGEGRPDLDPVQASDIHIAIVHGQWHERIAAGLLDGARRRLAASGARVTEHPVPGSFELPVVAQAVLDAGADGVVALGVIIRGGTPHFEYVSQAATLGLTEVAIRTGKPVGFGVLTLDDEAQGIDRAGFDGSREDKGDEAASAVLGAIDALQGLRPTD